MPDRSVYFLETGICGEPPGIAPRTPGASFPFWGTHVLFDFAYNALKTLAKDPCWIVTDTRDRPAAMTVSARWGKGAFRLRDSENGLAELRRLLAADRAQRIVLSAAGYAAYLEPGPLADAADGNAAQRLRADGAALPVYLMEREDLMAALDAAMVERPEEATLRGFLLDFLPRRVRSHLDVPGRLFFVDNVMQLWESHHFLRENLGHKGAARYIGALGEPAASEGEARVTETGRVKDSLIASGAIIEGSVTDSVVFPGVTVRRGAFVHQSVLMTGNRIGAEAVIANTLILPWQQEVGGEAENVGAGVEIGENRNVMQTRNDDYPRHIARGLTLIAMNASIPPRVAVGAGCYVGPGCAAALKALKRLERGASLR